MLAATAEPVADAVAALGEVSVEWKLDGIRIQVHKSGSDVKISTRNLNDVTTRVGDIVHIVRAFPADTLVLDGEVIGGQDAASSTLAPWFFDVLHLDGNDLIDAPLTERRQQLELVVVERMIPGEITSSPQAAEEVLAQALASGHEGVMVKAADSPYLAGRRGKTWRKVKPVHTFDLVVLAIEWGHGRRTGKLSNLHLGAQKEWPTKFSLGKHSGSPTSPSSRTPSTITMS
jgi:DNA ligase-1